MRPSGARKKALYTRQGEPPERRARLLRKRQTSASRLFRFHLGLLSIKFSLSRSFVLAAPLPLPPARILVCGSPFLRLYTRFQHPSTRVFPGGKKERTDRQTQASLGPSIRDDLVPNIRLRASPRRSVTQTSLFHCSFSEWAARTSRRYISAASFMLCIVFEFRASSLLLLHQPAACARFIARYCLLALRANCRKVFEDIETGSGYWRWMYHRYRYADRR